LNRRDAENTEDEKTLLPEHLYNGVNFKPLSMPHTLKDSRVSAMERGWGEAKHESLITNNY
jgi:hypothetical protein